MHFTNGGVIVGTDPLEPRLDLWEHACGFANERGCGQRSDFELYSVSSTKTSALLCGL